MVESRSRDPETNPAPRKTTTEARQGVTIGRMRYILMYSVALAALAMLLVYLFII